MSTPRQNLIEAAARAFFSNSEAVFPSYNRYPRYEDALCYAAEKQFGAGSPEHEYFLSATDRAYNSVLLVIERLCKEQLEFFTDQQHGPDPRPDDLDCTGCKATVSHYDCMICKPSFSPLAPSAFNSIAAPAPGPSVIIEPPATDDDTQPSAPVATACPDCDGNGRIVRGIGNHEPCQCAEGRRLAAYYDETHTMSAGRFALVGGVAAGGKSFSDSCPDERLSLCHSSVLL